MLETLSLYSVKSLTLQMEKREPARWSVAGPQTRSRTRREQAEAGPSRDAWAQPGTSTENMSFEDRMSITTMTRTRPAAADSPVDKDHTTLQVCIRPMVHRCVPHPQHASTTRTRSFGASRTFRTASAHLVHSSMRCRTRWHTTPSSLKRAGG